MTVPLDEVRSIESQRREEKWWRFLCNNAQIDPKRERIGSQGGGENNMRKRLETEGSNRTRDLCKGGRRDKNKRRRGFE